MGSDAQYCSQSLITDDYPENTQLRVLGRSKHHWPGDERRGVRTPPLGYDGRLLMPQYVWPWSPGVALFDGFELETARLLNRLDLVD